MPLGDGIAALEALERQRDHLPPADTALTDLGNAHRLVARHGEDLRYVPAWGCWLVWDGRRWKRDEIGEVYRRAMDTVRAIYREAADAPTAEQREAIAKWATRSEAEPRIRAMVALAEKLLPVRPAELDTDPWLLCVANGVLDLRTGELRPHRREDFITKLAPVEYDPDATCPTWEAFLDRIMAGNRELIAFLQRAVGYSLTGDTSEQVLFLLYGTGANGKTTFLETIRALLGEYAQQADFRTFLDSERDGPRNDIARLAGARFVAAVEADSSRRLAESVVKALTGGDTVVARHLYREFFEFRPQFKLWLAANHKPRIRGTDEAIWRRIRLVPFTVTIPEPERDKRLPARLREELPGILAWAVRGCLEWQRHGLGVPPEVLEATASYRAEMDALADFLAERCFVAPGAKAAARDLYAAYVAWCEENGERPLSQREFGLRLSERGFERARSTAGRHVWRGIGLLADDGEVTQVKHGDQSSGISLYTPHIYQQSAEKVTSVTSVTRQKERHCRLCGGTSFWRSRHGVMLCLTCHPPGDRALVADD